MTNVIAGGCHCGNINVELHTAKQALEFTPRTCSCSLCKKHGASWISDPGGEAKIRYRDETNVSLYRFGTKSSDFIICTQCGVLVIATCEIEGRTRAVLNILAMPTGLFTAAAVNTDFDDETLQDRLARRAKNWTGQVTFF